MNRFVVAQPSQCIGCNTCMAACVEAHGLQGLVAYPRLTVKRDHFSTAPLLCHHCDDAPCAQVCPVGAIVQTDNSVQINESTCIGCKLCGLVCPFGAITPAACQPEGVPAAFAHQLPEQMLSHQSPHQKKMSPFLSWAIGVKVVAVKCDLCYFQEDGPVCVKKCPTKALHLVDEKSIKQMNEAKRQESLAQLYMQGKENSTRQGAGNE